MLNLRSSARDILKTVEDETGRSVQLMEDQSLAVLATLQMARNGAGFHILRYKPTSEPLDYLVAYQAGFVLRLYANKPDARFDLASTPAATDNALELLLERFPRADAELAAQFAAHLVQWILMSLRSIPIGMRIDQSIRRRYPDLHEQQNASIALQQQQNVMALSMNLQGMTVPDCLLGLSAAYALFSDDMTGNNTYTIPYEASGLLKAGKEMIQMWREIPESPEHDCLLVDAWAEVMNIREWYKWEPFKQ